MRSKKAKKANQGTGGGTAIYADKATQRRRAYASDPILRESTKEAARDRYRAGNPLQPSQLSRGLLTAPVRREVAVAGRRTVRVVETYTIPEAAAALGKSVPNFRRWVTGDLIPAPYLKDRERGYYCYSAEELRIMARVLAQHEQEFAYFCSKHETTSNVIHQSITGYRNMTFGLDSLDCSQDN